MRLGAPVLDRVMLRGHKARGISTTVTQMHSAAAHGATLKYPFRNGYLTLTPLCTDTLILPWRLRSPKSCGIRQRKTEMNELVLRLRHGAAVAALALMCASLPSWSAAQGQDAPTLLREGHRFYYAGEHAKAMDAYTRVLLADPQNLQALLNGSVVLAELGSRDKTVQWLERALKTSPADPEIRIALGEAHLRRHELAPSRAELEAAVAPPPKAPTPLRARARV